MIFIQMFDIEWYFLGGVKYQDILNDKDIWLIIEEKYHQWSFILKYASNQWDVLLNRV